MKTYLLKKIAPTALLLTTAACLLIAGMPLASIIAAVFAVMVFAIS
jgi:hypothetical protein